MVEKVGKSRANTLYSQPQVDQLNHLAPLFWCLNLYFYIFLVFEPLISRLHVLVASLGQEPMSFAAHVRASCAAIKSQFIG